MTAHQLMLNAAIFSFVLTLVGLSLGFLMLRIQGVKE